MWSILWTARAQEDLLHIADYIAAHSPAAALRLIQRIRESVLPLASFPYLFRESEKIPGCREIVVVSNYLVFYRVIETHIEVVSVKHGRQQFPLSD